ncbi:hypothetical protein BDR26DRAFT_46516 [Obelidium mucronatum]|nr:hypothetical protein BDR26DRAFT_46516 [Obelidium mucronatum]
MSSLDLLICAASIVPTTTYSNNNNDSKCLGREGSMTPPLTPTQNGSPFLPIFNKMSISCLLDDDDAYPEPEQCVYMSPTCTVSPTSAATSPIMDQSKIRYQSKLHYTRPKSLSLPMTANNNSVCTAASKSEARSPDLNNPSNRFPCTLCGKGFSRKHHLKSHLITHSKEYPHVCLIENCASQFRRRQDLLRHQRTVKH